MRGIPCCAGFCAVCACEEDMTERIICRVMSSNTISCSK